MSARAITWVLLVLMVATLPVLYFMFVIAGFLPLIEIVRLLREGPWGFRLFNGIHLVIYGAIFYLIARLAARWLARLPVAGQVAGVAAIAAVLVAVSFAPIYGVGHNEYAGVSVYRLFFPPPQVVPEALTRPAEPPKPVLAPQVVPQHRAAPQPAQAPAAVPAR